MHKTHQLLSGQKHPSTKSLVKPNFLIFNFWKKSTKKRKLSKNFILAFSRPPKCTNLKFRATREVPYFWKSEFWRYWALTPKKPKKHRDTLGLIDALKISIRWFRVFVLRHDEKKIRLASSLPAWLALLAMKGGISSQFYKKGRHFSQKRVWPELNNLALLGSQLKKLSIFLNFARSSPGRGSKYEPTGRSIWHCLDCALGKKMGEKLLWPPWSVWLAKLKFSQCFKNILRRTYFSSGDGPLTALFTD